ncbi:transketolase [Candidatus Woesearchaeota archaeon]|nr:transketolase [Candidatus Woesearchaeota archaeon]
MFIKKNKEITAKELKLIANKIRQDIIKMLFTANSGHTAGSLGMADIFTALYFKILNHDPANPQFEERDRLILSNGHICPAQYACMANAGYFPEKELLTLRKLNSRLQGHPNKLDLPGLENSSGPLAQGVSIAAGYAYAAKMDKKDFTIFCLMSDGEHQEGQLWEALMFAGNKKLNNFIGIIDRNNIQIDGYVENLMPLEPLRQKLEAFNCNVYEMNGNNMQEVVITLENVLKNRDKTTRPSIIIAKTAPGKGISFMENKYEWHGRPPKKEEAESALKELQAERERINESDQ